MIIQNDDFWFKTPINKGKECDSDSIPFFEDEETLPSESLSMIIGLPLIVMKMQEKLY